MATLTGGGSIAINMLEPQFAGTNPDSDIVFANNAQVDAVTPAGRRQSYYGSFVYDSEEYLVGGSVTGLAEYTAGFQLIYSISGFFMSVVDQWAWYIFSSDYSGQRALIFGGDDTITGSGLADILAGFDGNDRITGGGGNDTIYGGAGTDTAVFSGNRSDYQIVKGNGAITITDTRGIDGTDTLYGVEWLAFNSGTILANNAPVLTSWNVNPAHGTVSLVPALMFSAFDSDNDALTYEVWDDTVGNGYFRLNEVAQAERQTISVSAANLVNLDFKTNSTGNDTLYVRAYDGVTWTAWQSYTVAATPNAAPTVSASNVNPTHGTQMVSRAAMFSGSDADHDTLSYEIWDDTVGNGHFRLSGNVLAEKQSITISAGEATVLDFKTSSSGPDTLYVRAFDGAAWSEWQKYTVAAVPNVAPVVSVSNLAPAKGTSIIGGSDLVSVTDADGDTITKYRFFDGSIGGGRFNVLGVPQAEYRDIEVAANQLDNLGFTIGDPGTTDTLWVQAYDGFDWSAWKSFTVTAPQNHLPIVHGIDQTPSKNTTWVATSGMVSATDPDGDAILSYEFWDSGVDANSGYFVLRGSIMGSNVAIGVGAANIDDLAFHVGSVADQLWVRAFDGTNWSTWQSLTVAAPANIAPVITVPNANVAPAHGTATIAMSTLFSVSDADGDTIQSYEFWDSGLAANSGRFVLNGVVQGVDVTIPVTAANLANLSFRLGSVSDQLWVRAFDGTAWSAWKSVNVAAPPNQAPVTAGIGHAPGKNAASIAASSMVSATDADGDVIQSYEFWDSGLDPNSGHFVLNGAAQNANVAIAIAAADIGDLSFQLGTVSDQLWVRAFDGTSWSTWQAFTVAAPANQPPIMTIPNANVTSAHGTTSIAASSLFTDSDPDGDTIQKYEFWDSGLNANSGRFVLSGVAQGVDVAIPVAAADLTNLSFRLGTVSDELWIRAFDGTSWSTWKSVNVAAPPNAAPVVVTPGPVVSPGHVMSIAASSLFTYSDPDGDDPESYEFWDSGLDPNSGRFVLNGALQGVNVAIPVTAADLTNLTFQLGSVWDSVWVRAFDGFAWSAWKSVGVAAPLNVAPVVNVQSLTPATNQTFIAGNALFTVTDADDASMTRYRFYDETAGNGRFQLNGMLQAEKQGIIVEAADLSNFGFVTDPLGGDTLWVQVFDGLAWSDWKSFTVAAMPQSLGGSGGSSGGGNISFGGVVMTNVQFDPDSPEGGFMIVGIDAPVVSAPDATVAAGAAISVSNLLSASDPNDDAVVSWRLWDATTGGGAFRVNGVVQAEHQAIEVMADQLASVDFLGGNAAGDDHLWARASDGTGWGEWKPFTISTLAPV